MIRLRNGSSILRKVDKRTISCELLFLFIDIATKHPACDRIYQRTITPDVDINWPIYLKLSK